MATARTTSGFSALPGGYRSNDGSFSDAGSTASGGVRRPSGGNAWLRSLNFNNPAISRNDYDPRRRLLRAVSQGCRLSEAKEG